MPKLLGKTLLDKIRKDIVLFTRFVGVGIINTIFGYSCFALFSYAGANYKIALLMATVLGIIFNFKSTGTLVFKSKDNNLIFRFVFFYGIIYGVNVGFLKLLLMVGFGVYLGGAISLIPMALLSFFLMRKFVFKAPRIT